MTFLRTNHMLHIQNLNKSFGSFQAVDNLSLTVKPGDIYCLLGANGAGKTTTINLCLNFLIPNSGSITIDNISVQQHPLKSKRHITYIPENLMLYSRLTGLENLAYFCGLAGKTYSQGQLKNFLLEAGLQASFVSRRISTYSKGMRQKVGIALALAKRSELLLLDEPTSGLDPAAGYEFAALLTHLSEQGTAIFMATHDLFRAKETGTRIGIMRDGRLIDEFLTEGIDLKHLEQVYLQHMYHTHN